MFTILFCVPVVVTLSGGTSTGTCVPCDPAVCEEGVAWLQGCGLGNPGTW